MSNILTFPNVSVGFDPTSRPCGFGALAECVLRHRHPKHNAYWLKENAEILNVLASIPSCVSGPVRTDVLGVYQQTYADLFEELKFFPQYYRFYLSMLLDLEKLGFEGDLGQKAVEFVVAHNLVETELSDLQRAEGARLIARRGIHGWQDDLVARLIRFAARSETFAVPNKKACYELTHIVFYLTDYGRVPFILADDVELSLIFCGLFAFLDEDADLLAEVCLSLMFIGKDVPEIWQHWLRAQRLQFQVEYGTASSQIDAYHTFLMVEWDALSSGAEEPVLDLRPAPMQFFAPRKHANLITHVSLYLLNLSGKRTGNWDRDRSHIFDRLTPMGTALLEQAILSTPHFEAFYEGFARADVSSESVLLEGMGGADV